MLLLRQIAPMIPGSLAAVLFGMVAELSEDLEREGVQLLFARDIGQVHDVLLRADDEGQGAPILPGVAHLGLALAALGSGERALKGVRAVRFKRPLVPGDEVEVVLEESPADFAVRFEIRCRGEVASRGLLLFESDADASAL